MIFVNSNTELVCQFISKILNNNWQSKTFYFWRACEANIETYRPDLIIHVLLDDLTQEKHFIEYLETNREHRPKIFLISQIDAHLLFSFCDKYEVEGIIDFKCTKSIVKLVSEIYSGNIIRHLESDKQTNKQTNKQQL